MNAYRDELVGLCLTFGRQIGTNTLFGVRVRSNAGEDLGRLEEILLDPRTGKVTFALLSSGWPYASGVKCRAVPWQYVLVRPRNGVIINIDQEQLKTGPAIDSERTDLHNLAFFLRVHDHYGISPLDAGAPDTGQQLP